MGKFWGSKTPQEKANSFDKQFEESKAEAKKKQDAGLYPYDLDAAAKLFATPKGPKHRKGDKK